MRMEKEHKMLFSHVCIGTNDVERSKKFYDAIFKAMNLSDSGIDMKGRPYYRKDGQTFIICKPINGKEATYANGGTIGFMMDSPEQINQWYAAGVANGGISIEDPPGFRHPANGPKMYLAYLRDPDGNKLCGYFRE